MTLDPQLIFSPKNLWSELCCSRFISAEKINNLKIMFVLFDHVGSLVIDRRRTRKVRGIHWESGEEFDHHLLQVSGNFVCLLLGPNCFCTYFVVEKPAVVLSCNLNTFTKEVVIPIENLLGIGQEERKRTRRIWGGDWKWVFCPYKNFHGKNNKTGTFNNKLTRAEKERNPLWTPPLVFPRWELFARGNFSLNWAFFALILISFGGLLPIYRRTKTIFAPPPPPAVRGWKITTSRWEEDFFVSLRIWMFSGRPRFSFAESSPILTKNNISSPRTDSLQLSVTQFSAVDQNCIEDAGWLKVVLSNEKFTC